METDHHAVPNFSDPNERKRLSPSGIKAFINVAAEWAITADQARALLGGVDEAIYAAWQANPERVALDEATLTRVSLAIGIYKALNNDFGPPLADQWITAPNSGSLFAGIAPIEFMIERGESGMRQVRRLVDAWSAGNK